MDGQSSSVLVTGGRGFIGRAVVKLLQDSGCAVVSLDAAPGTGSSAKLHEVECDVADVRQLQRVFEIEAIGGIIHLAAILPTAAQREPARATEVNVQGSLHLLEMARRFGVRRFVFGSSLSVYGTCPPDYVVSEADRAGSGARSASSAWRSQIFEQLTSTHDAEIIVPYVGG